MAAPTAMHLAPFLDFGLATNRTGYFDGGKSISDMKTMRSFSALMIFFVGNVLPLRTLLTTMRLSPVLLAHAAWPPARFTSKRSKRITSSTSKVCIRNWLKLHVINELSEVRFRAEAQCAIESDG